MPGIRDTAVIRRGCPRPVAASQGLDSERGCVISADSKPRRASLTMLKFSGDEFDALGLVHRPTDSPVDIGTGFSHLASRSTTSRPPSRRFRCSGSTARFPRPRNRLNQAMTAHQVAGQAESEMTSPKEGTMASPTGTPSATDLPDYAPAPQSAGIGLTLGERA